MTTKKTMITEVVSFLFEWSLTSICLFSVSFGDWLKYLEKYSISLTILCVTVDFTVFRAFMKSSIVTHGISIASTGMSAWTIFIPQSEFKQEHGKNISVWSACIFLLKWEAFVTVNNFESYIFLISLELGYHFIWILMTVVCMKFVIWQEILPTN